jgi:hypothetical protein
MLASLEPEADGDDARCNDGRDLGVQVPFVNLQQRWVCGVLEPCVASTEKLRRLAWMAGSSCGGGSGGWSCGRD